MGMKYGYNYGVLCKKQETLFSLKNQYSIEKFLKYLMNKIELIMLFILVLYSPLVFVTFEIL